MTTYPSHIEYFQFEEDFVEDNLRCIPMVVRLKLDTIGIKLPLKAWSRFSESERTQLALDTCETVTDILEYKNLVLELAKNHSIEDLGILRTLGKPGWDNPDSIPEPLMEKFGQFRQQISISQWRSLTNLQRFALMKLSRPGHESKNFEKALVEFGLFIQEL
jgi:hypothetical protein